MRYSDGKYPEDLRRCARELDQTCPKRPSDEELSLTSRLLREAANRIAELEKEPLKKIEIQEICKWIVDTYPPDIFTGESGGKGANLVAEMRDRAAEILKFRKEAADAVRKAE